MQKIKTFSIQSWGCSASKNPCDLPHQNSSLGWVFGLNSMQPGVTTISTCLDSTINQIIQSWRKKAQAKHQPHNLPHQKTIRWGSLFRNTLVFALFCSGLSILIYCAMLKSVKCCCGRLLLSDLRKVNSSDSIVECYEFNLSSS